MAGLLKMKKLEKILRKHIEAATSPDVKTPVNRRPCQTGGVNDRNKICEAVKELRSVTPVGSTYTGKNPCAIEIQRFNTLPCTRSKRLKFSNVKLACERYRDSVRAALPAGSTAEQISEAGRKAMCDCIDFVRYGKPKTLSGRDSISDGIGTNIRANEFSLQISDAHDEGCNYVHLGGICDEIEKLNEFARRPDLLCTS